MFKKIATLTILSFFIGFNSLASFNPATLYTEYDNAIYRVAVYDEKQADYFFSRGFELEQAPTLGATVTEIDSTDKMSDFPTVYNLNLNALNDNKIEIATTTLPNITNLANLDTIGTITTGEWNSTPIGVEYGGTATTTLTSKQIMIGNGASGFQVIGFGTNGQFLTSGGDATLPSWTTGSIDESLDYDWTGIHTWSTDTYMASTSITQLTVNGTNLDTLIDGSNADSLHIHNYVKKQTATTTQTSTHSSTAEQTIFTESIPANTLGTDNGLRLKIYFTNLDLDTGTENQNISMKVKYGATTLITSSITEIASSLTDQKGYIEVLLLASGTTDSQKATYNFVSSSQGNFDQSDANNRMFYLDIGTSAIDSTSAQDFVVTTTNSENSATVGLTVESYLLEIIK